MGFGVQGHNCGYRHRGFWKWAHAYFPRADGKVTTLEALLYDMPLGLLFRKAILWHDGEKREFGIREFDAMPGEFRWHFGNSAYKGLQWEADFDGGGPNLHHLPYLKTDCTGTFKVANNSRARAVLRFSRADGGLEELHTDTGAVLEMTER